MSRASRRSRRRSGVSRPKDAGSYGARQSGHALISKTLEEAEIDEFSRDRLADIAEHFFPEAEDLSDLSPDQQASWLNIQSVALRDKRLFEALHKVVEVTETPDETAVQDAVVEAEELMESARRHATLLQHEAEEVRNREAAREEVAAREEALKLEQHSLEEELRQLARKHERLQALRRWSARRRSARQTRVVQPPPASPTYDRMFGNQLRWAIHVIRYALQQRRLRAASSATE